MTRPAARARRWPDLLIGLLVALLLVGFGVLLLRPDGRAPTADSATPAPADTPAATIPSAPSATVDATPTVPAPAADPAPAVTPDTPTAAADPAEPPTIAAAPVETTPLTTPAQDGSAPAGPDADGSTDSAAAATGTAESPAADATTPATPSTGAVSPRTGGAVAASERRVPLRSDYRITLGTFGTAGAATAAAAPVTALGYTVYPIDLGSQVVAQVGPYADEATARQALADIQRAYPRAVLYPPRNRSLTPTAPAADRDASTSSAPATPTPAPAPSGPTYLQVGAFDRVDSAQKLVQQLRDLGYAPTVNAPEGRKVTVLVGPYTGDAVTRTERRLDANGLDHFRVR